MKSLCRESNKMSMKVCAFCRHWYDPANSAITPKFAGLWEYEHGIKRMCNIRKIETYSQFKCSNYELKI